MDSAEIILKTTKVSFAVTKLLIFMNIKFNGIDINLNSNSQSNDQIICNIELFYNESSPCHIY